MNCKFKIFAYMNFIADKICTWIVGPGDCLLMARVILRPLSHLLVPQEVLLLLWQWSQLKIFILPIKIIFCSTWLTLLSRRGRQTCSCISWALDLLSTGARKDEHRHLWIIFFTEVISIMVVGQWIILQDSQRQQIIAVSQQLAGHTAKMLRCCLNVMSWTP